MGGRGVQHDTVRELAGTCFFSVNVQLFNFGSVSSLRTSTVKYKARVIRSKHKDRLDRGPITFEVTVISHTTNTSAESDNHDDELDSDGTSIVISQPCPGEALCKLDR